MIHSRVISAMTWATSVDEKSGERYWDLLQARTSAAYLDRSKQTIMRNQLHLGFDNSLWPALSRLLIMGNPEYRIKIHPRKSELDTEDGIALLNAAYTAITGRNPKLKDWRQA